MFSRDAYKALAFDILCVMALVIIGTRNHETDTGISGVLFVAAPFLIAVTSVHGLFAAQRRELTVVWAWIGTVAIGMLLRNLVFDRGTALPFVIVATLFLGATMYGWRAIAARRR
jgi:Protein of unknown function (DUF3054)